MEMDKKGMPIWNTTWIEDEFLTITEHENGERYAYLLFEPEKIIYVKNACLTETYVQGKDYILEGRKLILTPQSRMFYFTQEQLYGNGFPEQNHFVRDDGRPCLHAEGTFFHERQIAVTYTCRNQWQGYIPPCQGQALKPFLQKLKQGESVNIVLYGDSISEGANASGRPGGCPPYLPIWGELVINSLQKQFPNADIQFFNPSVGGKCSKWAVENAKTLVNVHHPDLVILAFGMNGGYEPPVFQSHIRQVMEIVRAENPDCSFVLVATSLPNPILTNPKHPFCKYQESYQHVLAQLCGENTVMANVTEVHKYLMQRKHFIDLTGNNVNHPNDFLVRIYAQCVLTTLKEKEKESC